MKIELSEEALYRLKETLIIEFLKDDIETIKMNQLSPLHKDDIKYDKKLLKAYKTILKYYGVDND